MTVPTPPVVALPRRTYSLRQWLDVVSGILLVALTLGGSAALGLAQRQRQDARLLGVVQEQKRLVFEVTALATSALTLRVQGIPVTPERAVSVRRVLGRLEQYLRTFQDGGTITLDSHQQVRLDVENDLVLRQNLATALTVLARYRGQLDELFMGRRPLEGGIAQAWQWQLEQDGQILQTVIEALAARAESRSLLAVVRASQLQLALIVGGIVCFLIGVMLLRRLVTVPLHRMADGIEAMRRSGRLVKLPVTASNELGVVASGFNQIAQQVEDQKQRLREHIVELQRVNAELDQLVHLKDDFLATINHQLRTPLLAIREGVGLLRDGTLGPLSEEQRQFVQTAYDNTQRLGQLIEDVLDLSMLKSGRRPLKRQPADLSLALTRAHERWGAQDRHHTIRVVSEALPMVYADLTAVNEVMDHLLRNALRHAPADTEVHIGAVAQDGVVAVSVRDAGPGLSREQLGQLFQPFAHVQTPDAPGSQGNGLGLALCRQVIERHRGTIRAESASGEGMTLIFTLPVASPQFLFEEACRLAREEAEREHGQFAVVAVVPAAAPDASGSARELLQRGEALLRRNTHRGDWFVWIDELTLAIVAVTDRAGAAAMVERLRAVLRRDGIEVRMAAAHSPGDGHEAGRLLEAARRRATERPTVDARSVMLSAR